jgi:hypothetical protein
MIRPTFSLKGRLYDKTCDEEFRFAKLISSLEKQLSLCSLRRQIQGACGELKI